jgi:general secretion pathway protein M
MRRLSKPVSRLAALGLLSAVALALVFGVALPIVDKFQDLAQALEDERRQLREYQAFAAQDSALAGLEERQKAVIELGEFLPGETELDRRSNLQAALSRLAEEAGIRITSARQLPDEERGPFKLVGMGLNLTTDIESVQKLLYGVETAKPYLFIESADISPLGGGAVTASGPRLLEVRLDIFAAPRRSGEP